MAHPIHSCAFSKNMDVDEVTIDANANWIPVDKPLDSKDDEGIILEALY